jgi:hypothetical protein
LDANPVLITFLQLAATMFVLTAIAKVLRAEFDRISIVILAGLSVFLGFFLFWLVEAIAAGFVLLLLLKMVQKSREPEPGPFVPPEFDEDRGLQDERDE